MKRVVVGIGCVLAGCALDANNYDHAAELAALGGGKSDAPMPKKTWTLLVYGAADNNLAEDVLSDLNELETVGSTEDVNLIAFLDTPDGASVHYLLADDDRALHSPTASWGVRDSGDWRTLADVAAWATSTYPADRYAVVISGHGGGSPRVIAPDDSTGHAMTMLELARAIDELATGHGRRIDVFGADACLMQTFEVAGQLARKAAYLVASENTEPATGWDYAAIGNALVDAPDSRGRELAVAMVDHFAAAYDDSGEGTTLAALSADALLRPPGVRQNASIQLKALGELVQSHAATRAGRIELRGILERVVRVDAQDPYADAIDFTNLLATEASSTALRAAAKSLREVLVGEVIAASWSERRADGVHGLSLYLPGHAPSADELAEYAEHYEIVAATHWDGAIRAIWAP